MNKKGLEMRPPQAPIDALARRRLAERLSYFYPLRKTLLLAERLFKDRPDNTLADLHESIVDFQQDLKVYSARSFILERLLEEVETPLADVLATLDLHYLVLNVDEDSPAKRMSWHRFELVGNDVVQLSKDYLKNFANVLVQQLPDSLRNVISVKSEVDQSGHRPARLFLRVASNNWIMYVVHVIGTSHLFCDKTNPDPIVLRTISTCLQSPFLKLRKSGGYKVSQDVIQVVKKEEEEEEVVFIEESRKKNDSRVSAYPHQSRQVIIEPKIINNNNGRLFSREVAQQKRGRVLVYPILRRDAGAFSCKTCGKRFDKESNLKRHESASHREAVNSNNMTNNKKRRRVNNNSHGCPHCYLSFDRRPRLEKHVENVHAGRGLDSLDERDLQERLKALRPEMVVGFNDRGHFVTASSVQLEVRQDTVHDQREEMFILS